MAGSATITGTQNYIMGIGHPKTEATTEAPPAVFETDPLTGEIKVVTPSSLISFRPGQHNALVIGDSLAAQETPTSSGGYLQQLGNSLFQSINYRLGQRLNIRGILGLSGQRSDQIATALPAFLTSYSNIGYGFVFAGANDVAQYITAPRTVAQYKASMEVIISTLLNSGITPVVFGITGSASTITTAAMADMWVACNYALRDLARQYPAMILMPTDNAIIDVAATYPAGLAAQCDGSFHPNSLGALTFGNFCYSTLNTVIPPVDIFPSHYHAGAANELALTANPLMTGTAAAAGILSGNVPAAGVTVSGNGTGSGVASLLQNTNAPTGSQWCQVVYAGPASAVNGTDYVNASTGSVALATAGLAVGDTVQGFWEFAMTGTPANFMGAEIFINFVGATGSVTPAIGPAGVYSRSYGMKQNNGSAPLVALGANDYEYGVLATPSMPIPTGTTALQLFVRAYPVSGSSGATFTVQFGRQRYIKT